MSEIKPNEIYTTEEARELLKISPSTIKRLLKSSVIRANKVGGQYRILGKELLRVVSPSIERKAVTVYQRLKHKAKREMKHW